MKHKIIFSLLLVAILLFAGCAAPSGEGGGTIVYITDESFESDVLGSDKTVLLDFYADWCGPCKMMEPELEAVSAAREDILVGKVNVDTERALVERFGIEAMPTLIVIKGGEVAAKAVGYRTEEDILTLIG